MNTDNNTDIDITDEETKEVYARYGLTAYTAQLFEIELGQFLIHVLQMQNLVRTVEELDSIVNNISQKTLGFILNELKKKTKLEPRLEEKLKIAVDKRNYLTHHYFYKNSFKFFSKKGQAEMIAELNALRELFEEAENISLSLSKITRKLIGYDENKIEVLAEETMKAQIKSYADTGSIRSDF
ncbi:MAG: hypothetical protein H8E42_02515 [Nitrospinae bacterium]|nr:hypothetical protein [Nitrospinota bacterium]MBL7020881.1 hypothetical protein [Nitrospinaceae bacterium]